jgi:hypothetical protein
VANLQAAFLVVALVASFIAPSVFEWCARLYLDLLPERLRRQWRASPDDAFERAQKKIY